MTDPYWYDEVFNVVRTHPEHCRCHTCLLWRELQQAKEAVEQWKSVCTHPEYGFISVRICHTCEKPYPEWGVLSISKCPECREGTALVRLTHLLTELHKRFPGINEYSAYPTELLYLEAIDALLPVQLKEES